MFVPGNRSRFIEKALALEVDAIFLDLEDGVPPAEKPSARELVAEALRRPSGGPARYVRINAVGSRWFEEDLTAVLVSGLEGLCLPKVEAPEEVREAAGRLAGFDAAGRVRIVAAIESARGLVAAAQIAAADPRVIALMLGAEDFALDLGLGTRREGESRELLYARSALVVAAASAHVMSIDGVFPDLENPGGLLAEAVEARRLGFSAKSTFNPRQVELINRTFLPSEDEISYARRVVRAFDEASARGDGSVAVGGQLVDRPIVLRAKHLLAMVSGGASDSDTGGN